MKTSAMVLRSHGGPDALRMEEIDISSPAAGEALIRHTAIGLNFVDVYYRSGQFGAHDSLPLPAILGVQGAGVVEAVGPGTTEVAVGDSVTYVGQPGAYSQRRLIPAARLLRLPADISPQLAAAALLRGLTCEYLLRRLYVVKPGDTILFHAAAGGLGLIACQWAAALGARVIGTVGSDEKAALARAHGCEHTINYSREDFVARVLEITGGKGVPVVYDSVGRDTFVRSLDCLQPMGLAVNFGTASGQVEPFPLQLLHRKSLFVTRPTLTSWIADRAAYAKAADAVFDVLRSQTVRVDIAEPYALGDVSRAHSDLEARRMKGLPVLLP